MIRPARDGNPGFRLEVHQRDGRCVIALAGEFDLTVAEAVQDAIVNAERGSAGSLLLDLSDLTFLDSTGIFVLVSALKRGRKPVAFRRSRAGEVRRVLEITGLEERLPYVP